MVDWLNDFERKFSSNDLLATLKERKFHGKVVINFADGVPHTSHIDMCIRAVGLSKTTTQCSRPPTLKQGVENE